MEDKYDTWCLRAWRRRCRPAAIRPLHTPVICQSECKRSRPEQMSNSASYLPIVSAETYRNWHHRALALRWRALRRVCHHALHMTNGYYQRSCSTRQYRFIINIDSQSFSSLFRFGRFGARRRGSGPGSAKIKLKRRCFIFPCSTLLLRRRQLSTVSSCFVIALL